jgi:hypothetical protein
LNNLLLAGYVDSISHSLCKLLVAVGDHSTSYLAANLASLTPLTNTHKTKAQLVQTFLKFLLAYSSLPGYYGADEDESEMALGFWYLFQEALWSVDYNFEEESDADDYGARPLLDEQAEKEAQQDLVAKALYSELVQVLLRKVVWPPAAVLDGWAKGLRISCECHQLAQYYYRSKRKISSVSSPSS